MIELTINVGIDRFTAQLALSILSNETHKASPSLRPG